MDAINPCCATWKMRYSKMEEKRNALRQGVDILKSQIDRLHAENGILKKACDEERRRAEAVKEEKEKEAALRFTLEKEIDALKSELTSTKPEIALGNEELNNEITRLHGHVAEREKEIHELKELLTEVQRRAEAEREGAELARKKASELQEALESEKFRADEACKMAEESQVQLEKLKKEVKSSRLEVEEVAKKLEAKKQKAVKEKKRADEEKARSIEQRKIAEANEKKYMDEQSRTSGLLTMLEEEKQKFEKLQLEMVELVSSQSSVSASELDDVRRNLEAEKTKAEREKKRADEEKARSIELSKIAEGNEKKYMDEKGRASGLLTMLEEEKQKVGKLQEMVELVSLQSSASASELDDVRRNLEAEKKKAERENKRVDEEKARCIELSKIAEANEKKYMDEKGRASGLMTMLAEEKQKVEKLQLEMVELVSSRSSVGASELDEVRRNLEAEKKKAGREKKHANEEKARSIELSKIAEANEKKYMDEKSRASGLLTMLEEEKQKVEKLKQEMVELVSSRSSASASELNEVKRNLAAEKKKADSEKKRADSEMLKKEELKKVAEANIQKAMEEKSRANELCRDLQCCRQRIEELEKKILELNELLETERANTSIEQKRANEEKLKAEELQRVSLLNKQRVVELEDELHKYKSWGNPGVSLSVPFDANMNALKAKVNLLKEQLKFEKERVKHAKDVAELEKERNGILQKEMNILRQDFECLLHHLDVLGDNFGSRHGLNNVSKKLRRSNDQTGPLSGRMLTSVPPRRYGPGDAELRMSSMSSRDESYRLPNNDGCQPPDRRTESPSGMEIDLDLLLGGSRGETLPNCALNLLYTASFSDEQLVGSQERFAGSLTTSVKMASENTKLEERVGIVAENNVRIPVEVAISHAEKTRNVLDEIESIKCMNSQGKKILQEVEEKISFLHSTLTRPIIDQMKETLTLTGSKANACGNYDQHGMKRKRPSHEPETILPQLHDVNIEPPPVSPRKMVTRRCCEESLISFEQMIDGDYMKLLYLDDVEEELFKTAMEIPVSPSLPEIACHDSMPISVAENADVLSRSALNESRVVCLVFPDMNDGESVSKVFRAIKACSDLCGLFLQRKWLVQDILAALVLEEDLTPREKVCALFSLMLINVSEIMPYKFKDLVNLELRDSFSAHLRSVLLDGDTRSFFVNTCDLSELLSLAEGFVFSRRILLESNNASLPVGSSYEVLVKGKKITLSPNTASTDLITGGCFLLASICRTVGRIDFVCEVSFNLLHSCGVDKPMTLTILHIFAYLCGEELFTSNNFCLVMEVVKSIVKFIEGTVVDNDSEFHSPCDSCPFSKACASLDDVSSLLLEELNGCCSQNKGQLDYKLYDILSSLELIASTAGWDWACDKIVPNFGKIMETCNNGEDFVAIVSFLGQLGRHGAEAFGYDNAGVETIRSNLLEILYRPVTFKSNTSPPIPDLTVLCALLGLYPHICEELRKGNTEFLFNGEAVSSTVLKECLSSLSGEQITALFSASEKPENRCVVANKLCI